MKADQKEKCLQAYYRTDIEPTLRPTESDKGHSL